MTNGHGEQTSLPRGRDDAASVEQPSAARPTGGLSGRLRSNAGFMWLGLALAVPGVVLAGIGATVHYRSGPVAARPEGVKTSAPAESPRPAPRTYPTRGEAVPPIVVTQEMTPQPTPKATKPSTRPSSSTRTQRRCPESWKRYPPLLQWCKQNGYRTD